MTEDAWPDAQDEEILARLKAIHERLDPVPDDLDALVLFSLSLADLDAEVARIVEDDLLPAGARGSGRLRTVRLEGGGLQVLLTVHHEPQGQRRIDGWLAPAEPALVEVRSPGQASPRTIVTDDGGRFVVDDFPSGPTQFVIRSQSGTLVTPTSVW